MAGEPPGSRQVRVCALWLTGVTALLDSVAGAPSLLCDGLDMRLRFLWLRFLLMLPGCCGCVLARAQQDPAWTRTLPPFQIAGNLYYVGSEDLAAYLAVTPQGNILINSNLESSPGQIRASIERLGFRYGDTKILLISHAHFDHAAGSAEIKRETRAKYMVMAPDVKVVEDGGASDFYLGKKPGYRFPRATVDRVLHDGDRVTLGGTTLVAHLTAGHTRGCTTWTMQVVDHGKQLNVVIVGSPNVLDGYKLVGNKEYPAIAADYAMTFRTLHSLPCDIFLGAHGSYFGLKKKLALRNNGGADPFIDPAGYQRYVAEHEQEFEGDFAKQQRRRE